MRFDEGELGGAVNGDEQVELALGGADFSDVEVKVTDGLGLEAPFGHLCVCRLGQAADVVALQAAVQTGAGELSWREKRASKSWD